MIGCPWIGVDRAVRDDTTQVVHTGQAPTQNGEMRPLAQQVASVIGDERKSSAASVRPRLSALDLREAALKSIKLRPQRRLRLHLVVGPPGHHHSNSRLRVRGGGRRVGSRR
jgi:hypothetical protein